MRLQSALEGAFLVLLTVTLLVAPVPSAAVYGAKVVSSSRPLPPDYRLHGDGSVTQRICYNWACSTRQYITFTAADMDEVRQHMALCPGDGLHDRIQRVRIGIWQMEALAQKYQSLLGNDKAINDYDHADEGRMDCIDNASNTTNFLHVLRDLKLIPEWAIRTQEVRDMFSLDVHWTAVVVDKGSSRQWAVDSWFRGNGNLPFVMPLAAWQRKEIPWDPPYGTLNPYPRYTTGLCGA